MALIALPARAGAQQASTDPLTAALKGQFEGVSRTVAAAAQQMPEDKYGYRATPDVRTFGEFIGHIADVQYVFCSNAKGEPNPNKGSLEKLSGKAAYVKAIADSNAYCSSVWAGMTDKALVELVGPAGRQQARGAGLSFNTAHTNEHYGNLVTYLRINGMVPPSSQPR